MAFLMVLPAAFAQIPSTLQGSTLLGGSAVDRITDMAVAADGSVYVAGWTESADFPTTSGAFDRTLGGDRDAFVARLNADMTVLLASTYIGGSFGTGGSTGVPTWDAAI